MLFVLVIEMLFVFINFEILSYTNLWLEMSMHCPKLDALDIKISFLLSACHIIHGEGFYGIL